MSGTAYNWHHWLGSPLPFYDDPATQQATQQPLGRGYQAVQQPLGGWQTMQDTGGAGWSDPATPVPYTAPSTTGGGDWTRAGFTPRMEDGPGSAFTAGGTWDLPGWAYGGNQKGGGTYNAQTGQWDNGPALAAGSDVFGAKLPVGYDSAQDRGGLEYNGRNVETFWSRMLRFAKDARDGALRAGQTLSPEQAMQRALDRLRNDNGGTLAGTGFQEGGTGAGTSGGNTGGHTVGSPLPPLGSGAVAGAQAVGATTQPGGNPAGGPLNSMGGGELYNDPKLAWRYILQQAGADPDYQGPFSGFMAQEYAPLMMAFLNARLTQAGRVPGAQGLAGMDQIGNYLGQFNSMLGGNDLYTRLGQAGQAGLAAGGGLLNQASSDDAQNFMRQMLGLTGAGNGPLAQSAQQYLTNKMTGAYSDANLGQRVQGKFGDYLNSSGFLDRLRQLGLLP